MTNQSKIKVVFYYTKVPLYILECNKSAKQKTFSEKNDGRHAR